MSAINLTDLRKVLSKARDNKKKIKGLLALKKKLERGEFLGIAIMAMLKEEKRNHTQNSTLAEMEAVGGIQ